MKYKIVAEEIGVLSKPMLEKTINEIMGVICISGNVVKTQQGNKIMVVDLDLEQEIKNEKEIIEYKYTYLKEIISITKE